MAGKGVPAALYGAFASGTVRARAFQRHGPASLLERVNRTLRRRGVEGLFCTLTFALFDFGQRTMRIGNSGLPYTLHCRAETGRCETIDLGGLPLGTFDAATYDERSVQLAPGDVIVFHTDGISEAHNGKESFGMTRLHRRIEENASLPAPRIGEKILEELDAFMGDAVPDDDVTLVVVKAL